MERLTTQQLEAVQNIIEHTGVNIVMIDMFGVTVFYAILGEFLKKNNYNQYNEIRNGKDISPLINKTNLASQLDYGNFLSQIKPIKLQDLKFGHNNYIEFNSVRDDVL